MKNHRFPWLRNRTTDNRKCEKARNIKEKRTIEMFSTVSKPLVVHHSSARDNQYKVIKQRFLFGSVVVFICAYNLLLPVGPRNAVAAAELKTVHRTVFLTLLQFSKR